MTVLIARRMRDTDDASAVEAQKVVRSSSSTDTVNSHRQITIGAVLEANRKRHAACELPMQLRFSRASANGSPRDQISHVLRRDGVQKLDGYGHAHVGEVVQETAADTEALVDVKAIVGLEVAVCKTLDTVPFIDVGIIDQAFPAYRCSWLFEIRTHDNDKLVLVLFFGRQQQLGYWDESGISARKTMAHAGCPYHIPLRQWCRG